MRLSSATRGFKLIEVMISTAIISVVGLVLFSLLNVNSMLSAKNTAVNTAHQQARIAMLQMVQDLRSAVSLPQLVGADGTTPWTSASPAPGISFQMWSMGPYKILQDEAVGNNVMQIAIPANAVRPQVGQRFIVPTHQIEINIASVTGNNSNLAIGLASPIQTAILGTNSAFGDVVCFITDRCSYTVANNKLTWTKQGVPRVMSNDITNPAPFSTPTTPAGALYFRFVSAIDLSTADLDYTNRGFKSANVLLNGQVPMKARLTTFQ